MYLPYLRGKQFELIALRELSALPLDPIKISPIIEPIKISTSTLTSAIKALHKNNVKINLILNPSFGDFHNKTKELCAYVIKITSEGSNNVIPTFLVNRESDYDLISGILDEYDFEYGFSLVHLSKTSHTDEFVKLFNEYNGVFNVILMKNILSLRRAFPRPSLVYLTDSFIKKVKNSDYQYNVDESFSSDHLYFKEEGFKGYSDFLTVGSEIVDGGFLPYAIAIHLTYLDPKNQEVRIRHFVSDSNEDTSDVPGKLKEALDKLVPFIDANLINSKACDIFRKYHKDGNFPGLGVLKKLSIMHHIQLIQEAIV
jgi:hypothetical protein